MPFDGIVTHAITNEVNNLSQEARIHKIYQPTNTELVITFRNQRQNYHLLFSIHPMYARFHLTEDRLENPQEPPMFCMVLRKHLVGGTIEKIEQLSFERVVQLTIRSRDELGDLSTKTLIIEIMGRHSNIILVDSETNLIIDAMKHISPFQNRHRSVLPGRTYIKPPEQDKTNPLQLDGEDFLAKINFNLGKIDQQIVQTVEGFSPFLARDITNQSYLGDENTYRDAFLSMQEMIKTKKWDPAIYLNDKEDFHVLPISYLAKNKSSFPTVSEMLDQFFSGKAERDRTRQQAKDLVRFIKSELNKNKRKLQKHEHALKKAERANEFQKFGELLTAHLHEVQPGDKEATVIDYYDPEQREISIQLNPQKSPSENAQQFFKTYHKLKNSRQFVTKQMQETRSENHYFEQLLQQIELAAEEDIEEIREELIEEGYLKKRQKRKRKQKRQFPEPEQFVASDGTTIFVGKNNKQNDFLTTKKANRNDIWLHTKDIPGAHVVIRDRHPNEQTLQEAAQLAALFSQARESSNVPVDFTQVRHVSKPNGAKPGFVTYDQHQTIFVTPNEEIRHQLKKTETTNNQLPLKVK